MNGGDMAQRNRDPAIKLFGMKIPVPDTRVPAKPEIKEVREEQKRIESQNSRGEQPGEPHKSSALNDVKIEEKVQNQANETQVSTKSGVSETSTEQEKVFKRPDKILPCPRCNSLDTKFCYFNNYNVNQPRHFCKNCQRYWTAGGTMRNVPVGAGRRKNKHFASQYRQIIVSADGIPISGVETPSSAQHQLVSSSGNNVAGTVLKFGPEPPLCESMETVLNIGDQKRSAEAGPAENREEASSCASPGTQQPLHAYAVPPWGQVQWGSQPVIAVPSFCPPNVSVPLQFVSASYWGCMAAMWPGAAGNMSLSGSNGCLSPTSSTSNNSCCSGNGSPTLGKHSRDPNHILEEEGLEKCVVVPKTLKIDDPGDASKSPIWATLGINKPDQTDPIYKGVIFKSFQPKKAVKADGVEDKPIMGANPAALSRSHKFQEST